MLGCQPGDWAHQKAVGLLWYRGEAKRRGALEARSSAPAIPSFSLLSHPETRNSAVSISTYIKMLYERLTSSPPEEVAPFGCDDRTRHWIGQRSPLARARSVRSPAGHAHGLAGPALGEQVSNGGTVGLAPSLHPRQNVPASATDGAWASQRLRPGTSVHTMHRHRPRPRQCQHSAPASHHPLGTSGQPPGVL